MSLNCQYIQRYYWSSISRKDAGVVGTVICEVGGISVEWLFSRWCWGFDWQFMYVLVVYYYYFFWGGGQCFVKNS